MTGWISVYIDFCSSLFASKGEISVSVSSHLIICKNKMKIKEIWHTSNISISGISPKRAKLIRRCTLSVPANIYLFKVNKRNTRDRCGCNVFIVNSENDSDHFLVFLLLTLNRKMFVGIASCHYHAWANCSPDADVLRSGAKPLGPAQFLGVHILPFL